MAETELYYRLAIADSSFSPGAPISRATLFAGRSDQIRRGISIVYARGTHGIILGERGVGKTSLANCLVEFIPNPHEDPLAEPLFMTPRVNCNGASTYDTIWREVFSRITFIKQTQQAGFSSKLHEEIKNFAQLVPDKISPGEVQQFLELVTRQKDLIVVIDEFDKLRDPETKNLMAHTIKALSDHSVNATLLLVGVGDNIDELIAEHESITRCLGQIVMSRMSHEDVRELITKGLDRFNAECGDYKLEATDEALGIVALLSKGMPHYAHLLAQQMCCMAIEDEKHEITQAHVLGGMGKALVSVEQSTMSTYQTAIASAHKNALHREVLTAAALAPTDPLGFFVASDLRKPLSQIMGRSVPVGTYMKHLNDFCMSTRGSVLQKRGEAWNLRFRFSDALMQPYVIIRALEDNKLNVDFLRQNDDSN